MNTHLRMDYARLLICLKIDDTTFRFHYYHIISALKHDFARKYVLIISRISLPAVEMSKFVDWMKHIFLLVNESTKIVHQQIFESKSNSSKTKFELIQLTRLKNDVRNSTLILTLIRNNYCAMVNRL